ncbi:MAG: class I SAM-dependent methyltransferase [Pseudomonadota bacterium]
MTVELPCPLCGSIENVAFFHDARRSYRRCQRCQLVFVPPAFFLTRAQERAEYELHQNDLGDAGYRAFLSRLADPMLARLAPGARGLDFGCGPGPALAAMFREAGLHITLYDSFFYPDEKALAGSYDFITASEVVEHLHRPGAELSRLWSLLRPGGTLGVMTKRVIDADAFSRWHYKNDPTHVCFFSDSTWRWWAQAHQAELELIADDVCLLRRSGHAASVQH